MIDLHIHTTYSDGAYSVEEVLAYARQLGLSAISVTDHDTLEAYKELGVVPGLEVVKGIELSSQWQGRLVHLLGYWLGDSGALGDSTPPLLREYLVRANKRNVDVVRHICDHLREAEGIPVTYEELVAQGAERPTLALLALRLLTRGHAKNWRQVGITWGKIHQQLENKFPAAGIEEGIEALTRARALIVLAHPGSLPMKGDGLSAEQIESLCGLGVHGLELYHKRHGDEAIELYGRIAAELGLVISGGSDAHCRGKEPDIGSVAVDESVLAAMKERYREIYETGEGG